MAHKDRESIVSGINQLTGVLVITIPDCLLYSAWQRGDDSWDAEIVGAYIGQLMTSGIQGLRSQTEFGNILQVTLEMLDSLIVMRSTSNEEFVVAHFFESGTPLGWARLQAERTYPMFTEGLVEPEIFEEDFPEPEEFDAPPDMGDASQLSKGERLMKYLDDNAPDTHAALLRVSLQTGLPLTLLRTPDKLSPDDYTKVEESVRLILGVDQLNV